MRRLSAACMVFLASGGTATAQQLRVPASFTRLQTVPAAAITVEFSPQPSRGEESRRARILEIGDRDPTAAGSQILDRLPIDRLQRLLKKNVALRVVEAAVGATIVGYQVRRADTDSTIGKIGVQAIRFGGAEWLERSRFRLEPQIVRGGFVVSVKRNN